MKERAAEAKAKRNTTTNWFAKAQPNLIKLGKKIGLKQTDKYLEARQSVSVPNFMKMIKRQSSVELYNFSSEKANEEDTKP